MAAGRYHEQENRNKDFHIGIQQQVVLRNMHDAHKAEGQNAACTASTSSSSDGLAQHHCQQANADGSFAQDNLPLFADLAVRVQQCP